MILHALITANRRGDLSDKLVTKKGGHFCSTHRNVSWNLDMVHLSNEAVGIESLLATCIFFAIEERRCPAKFSTSLSRLSWFCKYPVSGKWEVWWSVYIGGSQSKTRRVIFLTAKLSKRASMAAISRSTLFWRAWTLSGMLVSEGFELMISQPLQDMSYTLFLVFHDVDNCIKTAAL